MPWTRTRPEATALRVVLPMYIPFCGIAVFRNVRKPAWLSGFVATLFPTVLQSGRPKKTAIRLLYRKKGGDCAAPACTDGFRSHQFAPATSNESRKSGFRNLFTSLRELKRLWGPEMPHGDETIITQQLPYVNQKLVREPCLHPMVGGSAL
jgi:hypothetical protein